MLVSLPSCGLYGSSLETYGEGAGTPGAATTDLRVVTEEVEGGLVAEGNVYDTVVSESAHGGERGALLSTTLGGGRDEQTSVLAPEGTSLPLATGLVPEGAPLGREVAVAGGDTEEEGIVLLEDGGVGEGGDGAILGRGVHLGEDLLGEGLLDLVEVDGTAGRLDALGLSLRKGLHVAVHRVLWAVVLVKGMEAFYSPDLACNG